MRNVLDATINEKSTIEYHDFLLAFLNQQRPINFPLRSLEDNLDHIPKNRPVMLQRTTDCHTAMGVMALLLGYDNVCPYT